MERMKAEQRRLKDDVNSVRVQSSTSKPSGDDFRSEERVARRAIPAEIFYGLLPRHTSLHPDPMTLSDCPATRDYTASRERLYTTTYGKQKSGTAILQRRPSTRL